MWKNRLAFPGLLFLGIAAGFVGLASIRGEPPRQAEGPPPKGDAPGGVRAIATDLYYTMKLSNGLDLKVYPRDPLHAYDTSDWYAAVPLIVTDVHYDAGLHELAVAVEYSWRKSDEADLRKQLEGKYRDAGKPVSPEAISITKLEPVAHSLLLLDGDKEYLLFSSDRPTAMTAQPASFHLPMTPDADRLHQRLARDPRVVQIALRAGYRWDKLAGLTVTQRALASAFEKVKEKVGPQAARSAGPLLLDRDAEAELRKLMASEVATVIKSFGLTPAEETAQTAQALAAVNATTKPTTLSIAELLQLQADSLVWTVKNGQSEAVPAITREALTKLTEWKDREDKVDQWSDALSEKAHSSSLDDEHFFSEASRLILDAKAGGSFVVFSASASLHLDKAWGVVSQNHLKEFKAARAYVANKSQFKREIKDQYYRNAEGDLQKSEITAKLLTIRRVSAATLASQSTAGWSFSRINGSDVIFTDTPLPLRATPPEPPPGILADLVKRIRDLERQLASAGSRIEHLERLPKISADPNRGSLRIGDLLMCWGRADLKPDLPTSPHTRSFNFQFPVEFDSAPAVTTGFDVTSVGHVFGVFNSQVGSKSFAGQVFDNKSGGDAPGIADLRVAMSYVAIGKPKK